MGKYNGVFPAFYACYDDKGDISPERVRSFTEYLMKKGVNGLYVGGSSGECIYHNVSERKVVLENVMKVAAGKITVIAHVACNNTKDSMELASHAQSLGVDAIASIPPIYFKLPEYAIASYWNRISSAAPDTDFIIYNIPQLAGTALTLPLLREMLKNKKVIGVKNSSMPVQDIQIFKMVGGDDFIVFNGPDEQFISGLAMGACGGIGGTYAAMPELYIRMHTLVNENKMEEALKIQNAVDSIIYKLCSAKGNMYAVIKEVLRRRERMDIGGVREPMFNLVVEDDSTVDESIAMIDAAMQKFCR